MRKRDVEAVVDVLAELPYVVGVQGLQPVRGGRLLVLAVDLGVFFFDRLKEGDAAAVEHGALLGDAAVAVLEREGPGCHWHGLRGVPGARGVPGPAVPVTALVCPEVAPSVLELQVHLRREVAQEVVVAASAPLQRLSWSAPGEVGAVTVDRIDILLRPQPWFLHRLSEGDPHAELLLERAVASFTALLDRGRGVTVERVERVTRR